MRRRWAHSTCQRWSAQIRMQQFRAWIGTLEGSGAGAALAEPSSREGAWATSGTRRVVRSANSSKWVVGAGGRLGEGGGADGDSPTQQPVPPQLQCWQGWALAKVGPADTAGQDWLNASSRQVRMAQARFTARSL